MARWLAIVGPASRAAGAHRRCGYAACAAALAALIAAGPGGPAPAAAQSSEWPCDVRSSERIVAVGDVHGAYERFVAILRTAGLIDQRERWVGGKAIFIQTGDVLDRGP